jgi:hypothetical protein
VLAAAATIVWAMLLADEPELGAGNTVVATYFSFINIYIIHHFKIKIPQTI